MEYYRLEVTLKYHLAQPFVKKGSCMRLWHPLQIQWPVVYWKPFLSYSGMKTLLVQLTPIALCLFLASPCGQRASILLGRLCWYCSTGMGCTGRKDPAAFCFSSEAKISSPQIIFLPLPWTCSSLSHLSWVVGNQNKDLNVKVSQCDLYLLIILGN